MDKILKSIVKDLLEKQEIKEINDDKAFELLSNYSIISKEYKKEFDLNTVSTGNGDDTGIDGLAIIINGHLIEDIDAIEYFVESFTYLEVTYLFIQSKNTPSFEGTEINNFGFGVQDFFNENPKLRRNELIANMAEISNQIFEYAHKFKRNPECKLFYVSTGKYQHDVNNEGIKKSIKENLLSSNLFSQVHFHYIGANRLVKIYRELNNKISIQINFHERVTLPEIEGIKESYLGIIPLEEFKKLILDENNNLQNIFYDNIRDFQGEKNPVNTEIAKTLSGNKPELFTILNNGITIVANDIKTTGNKFIIEDYQIVNGCQTANILYEYIKNNKENSFTIPIKLIATSYDDIKNKITIATNSQTAIKREQLQAMTDFQKNLEQYYSTYQGDLQLFYERRAGQYLSDNSVIKARIINIQNQIKSFSAVFYENPDRVTTYFGNIVKNFIEIDNPKIFNENHQYYLYYISGLAYYRLVSFFKSKQLDSKYRKIKFFILMLFRKLIQKEKLTPTYMNSSKKVNDYCNPIMEVLKNKNTCLNIFIKAADIIDKSGLDINDKQFIKQSEFTKKVIETFNKFY
jgi:hypothetical protein